MDCSLIKPSELEKAFLNEKCFFLNINRARLKKIISLLHVHSDFKPKHSFTVHERMFKCTDEGEGFIGFHNCRLLQNLVVLEHTGIMLQKSEELHTHTKNKAFNCNIC